MSADSELSGLERWLAIESAARLAQALESMIGQPAPVKADGGQAPGQGDEHLTWWQQSLNAAPGSTLWLGAGEPAWNAIGSAILKAAGIDDASAEDIRNTFLEAVSQAFSAVVQTLGARLGRELETEGLREETGPSRRVARFAVTAALPDAPSVRLLVAFSPELVAALQPPEPVHQDAPGPAPAGEPPRTMDLLLEVDLPVSVSFGRAQLPLKDVLKLTTGSIVELNRPVSEPVEIIVNNCVIARGEVVVIEGNYGVRIQQIVSRQERLRTLY